MPLALTDLDFATDRLFVTAWHDAVIDKVGLDPRSGYVEQFWLSILGPSTTWLLRRMAAGLDASPAGFSLPLEATARSLGLGGMPGRHGPFLRALGRCCQFGMARPTDQGIEVRRKVPPLTRRQVERLPDPLRAEHQRWQEEQLRTPPDEQQRRRARRLALSLLELGEDVEATERQLHRWRYHPALAREATAWAWKRHHEPAGDVSPPAPPAARTTPRPSATTAGTVAAAETPVRTAALHPGRTSPDDKAAPGSTSSSGGVPPSAA
jgi:hypothetical protein